MSGIQGAEHMSHADLVRELEAGGRVVTFDWAISVCVLSFARSSVPHLVRAGEGTFFKALPYTLLTLVVGWWAIPFGPIFTIAALVSNFTGGNDITGRILPSRPHAPPLPPPSSPSSAPPPFGGPAADGKSEWQRFKEERGG